MRSLARYAFVVILAVIAAADFVAAEPPIDAHIRAALERGVAGELKLAGHGRSVTEINSALSTWYRERGFSPAWIDGDRPTARAKEAIEALKSADLDGLDPQDYFIDAIDKRWLSSDPKNRAELDILTTLGIVGLAADASEGRFEPHELDSKLFAAVRPERPDLNKIAREVLKRDDIAQAIHEQFPRHRQYQRMREALAHYRKIAETGWSELSDGPVLAEGSSGPRVAQLAERLALTGDLESSRKSDLFGPDIGAAVKLFQQRHDLPTSGKVDAKTRGALNVPVSERIKTLIINMERWRWLQRDFADGKELLVNIAGYEVFGLEGGVPVVRIPVIVGKTYHATPVFSDLIRYIEVNPYWNVTPSIAANEMLPKLRKDPGYLGKQHMILLNGHDSAAREISPFDINWASVTPSQMRQYRIRQLPGPWNALGKYKFVFPNKYNVYLHDTSTPGLFSERERAFSHGCIRVGDPPQLALFLLDAPQDRWTKERLEAVVAGGKNQNVKLRTPVRVHLTYRTAWVDRDGSVQFRPDLYGRDKKMSDKLFSDDPAAGDVRSS